MRPRALDLFCGAGGASMGLYRAGFDVVGVDIRPQPRYPFTFNWMTRRELALAIPPAYSEYLGRQVIRQERAAA